jgi:ABC-2 type transport system permease protein
MPGTGGHQGIAGAPPPSLVTAPDGGVLGYRPRRTLPLLVEIRRQLTRRRTQAALGFLVVLPFLLIAAFKLGNAEPGPGAPGLVDLATTGAANFTLFTLFVSTGFLLVVIVALFAGDTVASEASWSSLRYLLAAPVPRAHLLRRKLAVALLYSAFALALLPTVAYLSGGVAFGWEPLRSPLGGDLTGAESVARIAISVGYVGVSLLFVAALGFLLGVVTDAPLGAVGGAVMLVIVSNILDAVTALGEWRRYLPTHWSYAWTDTLNPEIIWDSMATGALCSVLYAVILLAWAWRHFLRKDITS